MLLDAYLRGDVGTDSDVKRVGSIASRKDAVRCVPVKRIVLINARKRDGNTPKVLGARAVAPFVRSSGTQRDVEAFAERV